MIPDPTRLDKTVELLANHTDAMVKTRAVQVDQDRLTKGPAPGGLILGDPRQEAVLPINVAGQTTLTEEILVDPGTVLGYRGPAQLNSATGKSSILVQLKTPAPGGDREISPVVRPDVDPGSRTIQRVPDPTDPFTLRPLVEQEQAARAASKARPSDAAPLSHLFRTLEGHACIVGFDPVEHSSADPANYAGGGFLAWIAGQSGLRTRIGDAWGPAKLGPPSVAPITGAGEQLITSDTVSRADVAAVAAQTRPTTRARFEDDRDTVRSGQSKGDAKTDERGDLQAESDAVAQDLQDAIQTYGTDHPVTNALRERRDAINRELAVLNQRDADSRRRIPPRAPRSWHVVDQRLGIYSDSEGKLYQIDLVRREMRPLRRTRDGRLVPERSPDPETRTIIVGTGQRPRLGQPLSRPGTPAERRAIAERIRELQRQRRERGLTPQEQAELDRSVRAARAIEAGVIAFGIEGTSLAGQIDSQGRRVLIVGASGGRLRAPIVGIENLNVSQAGLERVVADLRRQERALVGSLSRLGFRITDDIPPRVVEQPGLAEAQRKADESFKGDQRTRVIQAGSVTTFDPATGLPIEFNISEEVSRVVQQINDIRRAIRERGGVPGPQLELDLGETSGEGGGDEPWETASLLDSLHGATMGGIGYPFAYQRPVQEEMHSAVASGARWGIGYFEEIEGFWAPVCPIDLRIPEDHRRPPLPPEEEEEEEEKKDPPPAGKTMGAPDRETGGAAMDDRRVSVELPAERRVAIQNPVVLVDPPSDRGTVTGPLVSCDVTPEGETATRPRSEAGLTSQLEIRAGIGSEYVPVVTPMTTAPRRVASDLAPGQGQSLVQLPRPVEQTAAADGRTRLGGGPWAPRASLVPRAGITLVDSYDFIAGRTSVFDAIETVAGKLNQVIALVNDTLPFGASVLDDRALYLPPGKGELPRVPGAFDGTLEHVRNRDGHVQLLVHDQGEAFPTGYDHHTVRIMGPEDPREDWTLAMADRRRSRVEQLAQIKFRADAQRFQVRNAQLEVVERPLRVTGNGGSVELGVAENAEQLCFEAGGLKMPSVVDIAALPTEADIGGLPTGRMYIDTTDGGTIKVTS